MKVPQLILALAACSLLSTACVITTPSSDASKTTNAKSSDKPADKPADAKKSDDKQTADVNEADNNLFTHEKAGIKFEKPDGWKHEADGDTMTLYAPDHSMSIVITVAQEDSLDQAINELDSELSNVMTDIESNGKPQKSDVNGMTTYTVAGTGKIQGTDVSWAVDLLQARRPVFVITFGKTGEWDEHKDEYAAFARSIRKI
jgi:predicted Zn-dependent protease